MTVGAVTGAVMVSSIGIRLLPPAPSEHVSYALAGPVIILSGLSIKALGQHQHSP